MAVQTELQPSTPRAPSQRHRRARSRRLRRGSYRVRVRLGERYSGQQTAGVVRDGPPHARAATDAVLGRPFRRRSARADSETFAAVHRAWLDYQVLLFRDQELTNENLGDFSRRFGDLDNAPVQETGRRFVEGHPEIYVISNVVQDGSAIGSLGSGEAVWHTDMSYLPDPPKASALYALEVPPHGGDTIFCSMYAAWDELPDPLRRRVEGLQVKHDGTYNSGGYTRQGITPPTIRASRPAPFTRSCLSIRKRGGAASIWAGGAMRTSTGCRSTIQTRCLTTSGATARGSRLPGGTAGVLVISCSGTIAARCIAATRSIRQPAA